MTVKQYEMKVRVERVMFYNEDSLFGIYSCAPLDYNREITNKYGNFSLQGTSRKLAKDEECSVVFEGSFRNSNPKFDDYYKIIEVEPEKLNTVKEQDSFLKAILADNHFNSLKKAYPDDKLVDLILNDKIDTKKTKGIKEKSLAKIKDTVQKNAGVSVLITKLNQLNLSTGRLERILKHFGSSELAIKSIDENIYSLCDINSFGFLTVDRSAITRGDEPTNKKRIKACINHLLKTDNSNGHTWSHKFNIIEDAVELLNIDTKLIEDTINEMSQNVNYYSDNHKIAFNSIRKKEEAIYEHLKRIRDNYIAPDIKFVEENLTLTEKKQGFDYSEQQREAILQGSQAGVFILNGVAGSGKTTCVRGLIDSLDSVSNISCALSGKAVQVLSNRGVNASTIHRLLKYEPKTGGFVHDENLPLTYEIVIIDETSMVNVDLFLSVVRAVPSGSLLVIAGDSGQLSCIGSGDVLADLLGVNEFFKYELNKVYRQAADSGILSLANSVREGNQILPYDSTGKKTYGNYEDQVIKGYADKSAILIDILNISKSYKKKIKTLQDLLDYQILVTNKERGELSVRNINLKLQEIFNNMDKPSLNRNGYEYREGDKVILNGNTYDQLIFGDIFEFMDYMDDEESIKERYTNIYNGTMGYVYDVDIKHKTVFIQFENTNGIVALNQNELDKIELAYAITVHRSQGSSFASLVFATDFGSWSLLSRQMVYTALTRASKKSIALFETNAMVKAINNDVSSTRRTFLGEIIRNDIKGRSVK